MSIFDIFRSSPTSTAAAPATGTGTQPGELQNNTPPEPTDPVSSLDTFKDLWQNDAEGGETADDLETDALFTIDAEKINDTVSKINFAQVLDAETLGKISEGGEEAQRAFALSLNKVAQQVFSQSMLANATLVKQALSGAQEKFDKRAQQTYRQTQVSDTVRESNPAFKHPSVAPMIAALETQLAHKYPTASPAEISQKAQAYFTDFADAIRAPEKKAAETKIDGTDWEAFFQG